MKTHTDERGLTRFFLEPKDVEIPDEPIVVDKDLLQDIRNHLAYDAWDKANTSSEVLLNKLDSLYPYLTC